MSRKALEHQNKTKFMVPQMSSLIKSSSNELIVAKGFYLAIVDEQGLIIRKGDSISNEVFNAVSAQVVKSLCSRFTGLNENDFKKTA